MAESGAQAKPPAPEGEAGTDPANVQNVQDLTGFVHTLLTQMQDKFQGMSDQILGKLDEMTARVDELESQVGHLIKESGVEAPAEEKK